MSIILSSYQHCDEQQFQTLSCALYTILTVIKLDLFIQALLLDYIKWEDTIKSITQVYLQQIREKKNTNNYKKQAKQSHAYYYQ